MRITNFQVKNYKSFYETNEVTLSPGFNLVIGQNNVGKSALLELLSPRMKSNPHRSSRSLRTPTTPINPISSIKIEFELSGSELRDILLGLSEFDLPIPGNATETNVNTANRVLDDLFSRQAISVPLEFLAQADGTSPDRLTRFPVFNVYPPQRKNQVARFFRFKTKADKSGFQCEAIIDAPDRQDVGYQVATKLKQQIYQLRAERMNIGRCASGADAILQPNAENLPKVLRFLEGDNPVRFDRFNELVRDIFPSIFRISVRSTGSGTELEVVSWTEDPKTQRPEFAIELTESGTGISQVLAILYVVLTADFPRTIVIDEPNSFLHPGAARKLIEILRRFPEHQYIVSTHSPEIIRAADPNTVLLLRWERPVSVLETVNIEQARDAQRCLLEVGARLSDVFGADQVLWVEGPTEEVCFPLILNKLSAEVSLPSTSIVALRNTGDLAGKHAEAIVDIYTRLSRGNALVPRTVGFLLDREQRTEQQQEDLSRRCGGLVQFLPRRTFENYLLYPAALKAVMDRLPTFAADHILEEQISGWLVDNGGRFLSGGPHPANTDIKGDSWLKDVHGAKLLEALFAELSHEKEMYRKTTHSVQLVESILQNDPNHLKGLADVVVAAVQSAPDKR